MGGNNECFENFERHKYLKKLPSMQRAIIDTARQNTVQLPLYAYLQRGIILSKALQSYGPLSECSPYDGEQVYEVS